VRQLGLEGELTALPIDFGELLKGVPLGAWVAISHDCAKVVAFGSDLPDVVAEARSKGEEHPIVTKVPQTQHALAY
jgi:hypothetical protein